MPTARILTDLKAIVHQSKGCYQTLARGFDTQRAPSDAAYQDLTEQLERALPLLEQARQDHPDAALRSGLAGTVSSFTALLEQCREPFQPTVALHLSPHVRLYPFYDAIQALDDVLLRMQSAGVPQKHGLALFLVLTCLAVSALVLGWWGMSCMREASGFNLELIGKDLTHGISANVFGLDDLEDAKGRQWRWSSEPVTVVRFTLPRKESLELVLFINNYLPQQVVTVYVNEREKVVLKDIPVHAWDDSGQHVRIPFTSVAGENRIRIAYGDWNNKDGHAYVPDHRLLGVKFYRFNLYRVDPVARLGRVLFSKTQ